MNWDDINNEKMYDTRQVYAQSKLCNILFTRELAKRLSNTKVTVNALHPGVVMTVIGISEFNSSSYLCKLIKKKTKRNWADTFQKVLAGKQNLFILSYRLCILRLKQSNTEHRQVYFAVFHLH
jgi:NAD(P)-dependent dehydrogenase (short-subunit alcohol dehydrogenase family)